MKLLKLILFLSFFQTILYAKVGNYYWKNTTIFREIANLYGLENEKILDKIQGRKQVYSSDGSLRVDLTIYDLIDQIDLKTRSNKYPKVKELFEDIKDRPLKDFGDFFRKLYISAKKNKNIDNLLKLLIFQEYTRDGHPLRLGTHFKHKGRLKRAFYQNKIFHYSVLGQDPEGFNLLKIAKKRVDKLYNLITPALTVTSAKLLKKHELKKIKDNHYAIYKKYLKEELLKEDEYTPRKFFKLCRECPHKNPINFEFYKNKFKDSNLENYLRQSKLIVNSINRSKLKRTYLKEITLGLLRSGIKDKVGFGVIGDGDINYMVLTPLYVASHLEEIKKILQKVSFEQNLSLRNDQALLHFKKYLKKNRNEIERRLKVGLPKKITIYNSLEYYDDLLRVFPSMPWTKGIELYSEKGMPIDVDKNGFHRLIMKFMKLKRDIINIQNLAGAVVGAGTLFVTGNPYASAAVSTLVRDAIYIKRFEKDAKTYLKKHTLKNLTTSLITVSGFAGGNFMHVLYVGGLNGVRQSLLTGRPIQAGAIVGAITSAINSLLPPEIANPLIKGMDKNFENAMLEYLHNSVQHATDGLIVSLVTDGDIETGIFSGVFYGIGETTWRIYHRGYKYDPTPYVTEEQIESYLNEQISPGTGIKSHNEILSERAYGGKEIVMDMSDVRRTVFRKDSPWRRSFDRNNENYFRSNYSSSFEDVSMGFGKERRTKTIIHEAVHHRQYQLMGFNVGGLKKFFLHEGILEDYVELTKSDYYKWWFPF